LTNTIFDFRIPDGSSFPNILIVYKGISFKSSISFKKEDENEDETMKEADEKLEITSTNTPYNTYWTKMKCVVKSVKHGDIDSKDSRNEKSPDDNRLLRLLKKLHTLFQADDILSISVKYDLTNTIFDFRKCVVKSVKHGDIDSKDSRNEKSHWFRELSITGSTYAKMFGKELPSAIRSF
jgi:hypothetical protein